MSYPGYKVFVTDSPVAFDEAAGIILGRGRKVVCALVRGAGRDFAVGRLAAADLARVLIRRRGRGDGKGNGNDSNAHFHKNDLQNCLPTTEEDGSVWNQGGSCIYL